jgi:hypothetical protein
MDVADRNALYDLLTKLQHPLPETVARVLLGQVLMSHCHSIIDVAPQYFTFYFTFVGLSRPACVCPAMLSRTRRGSSRRDTSQYSSRRQLQHQTVRFRFICLNARLEPGNVPSISKGVQRRTSVPSWIAGAPVFLCFVAALSNQSFWLFNVLTRPTLPHAEIQVI